MTNSRRNNPPLIEHIKHDDVSVIVQLLVEEHGLEKVLDCIKTEAGKLEKALDTTSTELLSRVDPLEEIHETTDPDDMVVVSGDDESSDDGEPVDDDDDGDDETDTSEIEEIEANLIAEKEALDGGDKYGVFDDEDNLLSSFPTKVEAFAYYKNKDGRVNKHYVDELVDGT